MRMRMRNAALSLMLALSPLQAAASGSWDALEAELYEGRTLLPAGDSIVIDSPYRSQNDARTPISARISGPEGRLIDRVGRAALLSRIICPPRAPARDPAAGGLHSHRPRGTGLPRVRIHAA